MPTDNSTRLTTHGQPSLNPAPLAQAGQAADQAAARTIFQDYRIRKTLRTRYAHDDDLARFAAYLADAGLILDPADLAREPSSWAGVSWGLVAGFAQWQLSSGYAIASINRALSTVKVYAKLAAQAGSLTPEALTLIKTVTGYSPKEGRQVDANREQVRRGHKKAHPVELTPQQAHTLKEQPDTPQGRRDALLVCLMLDHGLRVGEVVRLTVGELDLKAGLLRFYRPKVDKVQTHKLTPDTLRAAQAYLEADALPSGPLFRGSRKNGRLTTAGLSTQAASERISVLGGMIGLSRLSAHDLRHAWATIAARNGTPIDRLTDAGGWASPAMPLQRYIAPARIANEGVRLG